MQHKGGVGHAVAEHGALAFRQHAEVHVINLAVYIYGQLVAILAEQGHFGQSISYLYFHLSSIFKL